MAKGWKKLSGKWYYFKGTGKMASDEYAGRYYLSKSGVWDPSKDSAPAPTEVYGDIYDFGTDTWIEGQYHGRLVVPSVGISVRLYDSWSQSVVDAEDSAAYMRRDGRNNIGDHSSQGFSSIAHIKVGDIAEIRKKDGTVIKYQCYRSAKVGFCQNGEDLDYDGKDVFRKTELGGLALTTCANQSGDRIYVVLFRKMN